jgi:hypothetical protein
MLIKNEILNLSGTHTFSGIGFAIPSSAITKTPPY